MKPSFAKEMKYHLSPSGIEELVVQMQPFKEELLPELFKALEAPESPLRANVVKVLARLGHIQPSLAVLEKMRDDWQARDEIRSLGWLVRDQDDETHGRVIQALEAFMQKKPVMPKEDSVRYYCMLEVVEVLRMLGDRRGIPLLERQILKWSFDARILQRALIVLAEIDADKGMFHLRKQIGVPDENIRIVVSKMEVIKVEKDHLFDSGYFSIYVMTRDAFSRYREMAWPFKYEKGLIYILFGGQETGMRLAGRGQTESEIIEQAVNYLGWWMYRTRASGI